MNTEHIFQIAVSVDDDAIRELALKSATRDLEKHITDAYFSRMYGSTRPTPAMMDIIEKHVDSMLEKHKEEIIDGVITRLTEKLSRSKAMREKLDGIDA